MKLFRQLNKPSQPRRRAEGGARASVELSSFERENNTFRRNRTLTGSVSSHVSSISEASADMKSPRVHAHELTQKRRHIGILFLGVFIAAIFLFGLISQFTAKVVVVSNVTSSLDESYQQAIQAYLMAHPAERIRFLLNTEGLVHFLQSKTPEIAAIEHVEWDGFGTSKFKVIMRTPIAGWTIQDKQQYVDASGVAFARNYYPAPSVQIIDNSGAQVQTGQTVTSNRFLGFVGRAVGLAAGKGITVTQVVIPTGTTRQVELRLDGVPFPAKLTSDRTAGEQVEDMANTLTWLKSQNKTPQYIDVRVSGRAFYQ